MLPKTPSQRIADFFESLPLTRRVRIFLETTPGRVLWTAFACALCIFFFDWPAGAIMSGAIIIWEITDFVVSGRAQRAQTSPDNPHRIFWSPPHNKILAVILYFIAFYFFYGLTDDNVWITIAVLFLVEIGRGFYFRPRQEQSPA